MLDSASAFEASPFFVYMMGVKRFIKIGISRAPVARLSQIARANPFEVEMLATAEYKNKACCTMVELEIHKILSARGQHKKYEWFHRSPASMAAFYEITRRLSPEIMTDCYLKSKKNYRLFRLDFKLRLSEVKKL
ncbi:MAG: hypothetical protein COA78_06850 [Blastopirellula sp.]|nr:MAG: hypothetical protein COA78_06850 [Blastopirellula sp.]